MRLEPHGPDTFVGVTALYPWGDRLFGGQVVAQALMAATHTVADDRAVHSLHSYFIRAGSPNEPIRFEVERLRDGRSFCTRQVVARQSSGAILNLSVSFQVTEDEADVQVTHLPADIPSPDDPTLEDSSWGGMLDRRRVDRIDETGAERLGIWARLTQPLADDPVLNACAFAFVSDSAPTGPVRRIHPMSDGTDADRTRFVGASLDHSIWYFQPIDATAWHFFDTRAHRLAGGRGLTTGDVISIDGVHVATIAQEVLLRERR